MDKPPSEQQPSSPDWREVLKFTQEQQAQDRTHIKFLLGGAALVAVILAVVGITNYQAFVEILVRGYFREDRVQKVMDKAARDAVKDLTKEATRQLVIEETANLRTVITQQLREESRRLECSKRRNRGTYQVRS